MQHVAKAGSDERHDQKRLNKPNCGAHPIGSREDTVSEKRAGGARLVYRVVGDLRLLRGKRQVCPEAEVVWERGKEA